VMLRTYRHPLLRSLVGRGSSGSSDLSQASLARCPFPRLLGPWSVVPGPWTRSHVTDACHDASQYRVSIQHSDAYTCLLVALPAPPRDYPQNQTVTHRLRNTPLLSSESDLRLTTLRSTNRETMANRPLAPLTVHPLERPLPYQRLAHPPG
jgi:hypothetical protein